MSVRTEQNESGFAGAAGHPIRFTGEGSRGSLGERLVAAARAASAMHLTGAALIAADEAAIRALESRENPKERCS